MPSARLIGIGAFVIGGVALFALALFMIGERQNLFTPQFEVYAEFSRLSGLQEGAGVQVAGMAAGEVTGIAIPASPAARFRVRLRIRQDLHGLVRTDSVATIRTEGLVGGEFVLVSAGSERAPEAPAGGTISSREPLAIGDLLEQATRTVDVVNETILGLRGEIEKTILTINSTAHDADQLVLDVGSQVNAIAESGARIADNFVAISTGVREGQGTIGQLLTDDDLYRRMMAIASDAEQTTSNLKQATDKARQIIDDFSRKGGAGEGLGVELRSTLNRARQTLDNLAENTEALKHNWFFSGYFNRRGYFSLSGISPDEYRAGVLEKGGRVRLRVWLGSDILFANGPGGTLTLLDSAKARLDYAMADFLRYIGQVPFMVEGYAQQGTEAQRYVESRRRAQVVRDYLADRFGLGPESLGFIPLGGQAPGSPSGDGRWEGVAISVFVAPGSLEKRK